MLTEKNVNSISILYDKYAPAVFGSILTKVNNRQKAEYILEQTFINIWDDPAFEFINTNHLLLRILNVSKTITLKIMADSEFKNNKIEEEKKYSRPLKAEQNPHFFAVYLLVS